jgi:hypothetical protein
MMVGAAFHQFSSSQSQISLLVSMTSSPFFSQKSLLKKILLIDMKEPSEMMMMIMMMMILSDGIRRWDRIIL